MTGDCGRRGTKGQSSSARGRRDRLGVTGRHPVAILAGPVTFAYYSVRRPNDGVDTYLQTLNSISAEKNSTIIFPVPIDIIQSFMFPNGRGQQQPPQPKRSTNLPVGGGSGSAAVKKLS